MDYALALAHGAHIAATISASGIVFFDLLVAGPAFRQLLGSGAKPRLDGLDHRMRLVFWISLIVVLVSGAAWFLVVTGNIAERSPFAIFSDDTGLVVLTGTQFGRVWLIRLLIAVLLLSVWLPRPDGSASWRGAAEAALAAGLVCSLAWVGHAGATLGALGDLHLVSDVLHLAAAGLWAGGLLPLALLLAAVRRDADAEDGMLAVKATRRFSALAIVCVGVILATGIVNASLLVGGVGALFQTEYGRVLMLKLTLFMAMIALALENRFELSPRLPGRNAIRQLKRNCLIEAGLGVLVIFVVGVLTTLPPALHAHSHAH